MRTVAILQARTGSTRLPGKVLMDLAGAPLLAQVLRRVKAAGRLDDVVVATTTLDRDDGVVACAEAEGVRWFRGSEHDVLSRFARAAEEAAAEAVLRVTADCPLLDPAVIDLVVAGLGPGVDYASNVIDRTYPVGLDAEALPFDVLERLDRTARSPESREHVTWFVRFERPDLFVRRSIRDDVDNSDLDWSVDRLEDLELVRRLYAELDLASNVRPFADLVAHQRAWG